MRKSFNIIFFSICFLASLIAEAYCIYILKGDLFSVVGIGIVVLTTAYLMMDSIRSKLVHDNENIKLYLERLYREDSEKWSERYTELINLQKATYTATKKNTAMMAEKLEAVSLSIETLEDNNTKALNKLIELQKKSLEGQKNALNLEINYNKENTKHLISALREEGSRNDQSEQLTKILECLENNNALLRESINSRSDINYSPGSGLEEDVPAKFNHEYLQENKETFTDDFTEGLDQVDHIDELKPEEENASEQYDSIKEESESEAVNIDMALLEAEITGNIETVETDELAETMEINSIPDYMEEIMPSEPEAAVTPAIKPLYEDPNKALTADEIAALFASAGQ